MARTSNWLKRLLAMVEAVGEGPFIPLGNAPLRDGDNVVGEMALFQKRVLTAMKRLWAKTDELILEGLQIAFTRGIGEAMVMFRPQIEDLQDQVKVLSTVLLADIRDHFKLGDKPTFGIRDDFQVVWRELEPEKLRVRRRLLALAGLDELQL